MATSMSRLVRRPYDAAVTIDLQRPQVRAAPQAMSVVQRMPTVASGYSSVRYYRIADSLHRHTVGLQSGHRERPSPEQAAVKAPLEVNQVTGCCRSRSWSVRPSDAANRAFFIERAFEGRVPVQVSPCNGYDDQWIRQQIATSLRA